MLDQSILSVAPTVEVIDPTTLKNHARIDVTTDDSLIAIYIKAARQAIENYLSRALITQTWDAWFVRERGLYQTELLMPMWDVQGVVAVDYTYLGQSPATPLTQGPDWYQAGNYVYLTAGTPFWFSDQGGGYPLAAAWTDPNGATYDSSIRWHVQYTAGYGVTPASVPGNLILANLMLATNYYENRQGEPPTVRYRSEAAGFGFPPQVKKILDQYRRWTV